MNQSQVRHDLTDTMNKFHFLGLNLNSNSTFSSRLDLLSLSFLASKPPSLSEGHLLVSWACSPSTCWYHLFAARSFPTLALPTRNVAFQQSLIAHGESCPTEGRGSSSLCVRKSPMKDGRLGSASFFSSRYHLRRSFSPANVCVMGEIDWRGGRGDGRQRIPDTCPGIPGMYPEFPNLFRFTFPQRGGAAPPCCSMSALMHAELVCFFPPLK